MAPEEPDLDARLRALEAYEQIRQLAARYALALDSRNIEELAGLFVADIKTEDGRVGRRALADWYDSALRSFTTTFHLIGNHIIDLVDEDHATGIVYCRPEHEVGDLWIVMPLQYWDRYERRDGIWYFNSRSIHVFYAADILENPAALPSRFHFPGNPILRKAELPECWDSWQRFWAADPAGNPR
jgi:SnoaL-like protein